MQPRGDSLLIGLRREWVETRNSFCNLIGTEPRQTDQRAAPVSLQLKGRTAQDAYRIQPFKPPGEKNCDRMVRHPTDQKHECLERHCIRPLEVVDEENERIRVLVRKQEPHETVQEPSASHIRMVAGYV